MKVFGKMPDTLIELTDGDLDAIRGAEEKKDWTQPGPYLEVLRDAQQERITANRDAWSSFLKLDAGGVYDGWKREVDARQEIEWAKENLNSINHGKADAEEALADRRATIEQLQKQEQEEHAAEEKRQREREAELKKYLDSDKQPTEQEVKDFVNGNGGGSPPANEQPYGGESPSIPSHLINAPPPHTPQIIIEPVGAGSY